MSEGIKDKVAIIGMGCTKFGERWDKGPEDLIVEAFQEGVEAGIFRSDIDGYLVRNLVLGFIEHLTTQWLVVGRPERISEYRDTIHDMVMRAIENRRESAPPTLRIEIRGASAEVVRTDLEE